MKKVFAVLGLCVLMLSSRLSFAQHLYDKGDVLLNVGLGFGNYFAGGVPFVASVEFAVTDAISVGPYLGYTSWRYSTFSRTYSFIDVGARGSYHFSKHINMNTDKLDLYGAAILGYTVSSYSGDNFIGDPYPSAVRFGVVGGARWYFTDKFSANGEVGYGIAPLLLGISFKL